MRKVICLALVALMILGALPALAGAKPTEAQFVYRYTALLGLAGEELDSDSGPQSVDTLEDGSRAIMLANCLIVVDPSGSVKQAGIWFPSKEIEPVRGTAFLLALDTDFDFDAKTQVLDQIDVVKMLADVMVSGDKEYCGYKLQYAKQGDVPEIIAQ